MHSKNDEFVMKNLSTVMTLKTMKRQISLISRDVVGFILLLLFSVRIVTAAPLLSRALIQLARNGMTLMSMK